MFNRKETRSEEEEAKQSPTWTIRSGASFPFYNKMEDR